MKKLLTLIILFLSLNLSYSQEIMEWSIGTPVVSCGTDPVTDPTTICYPLQVSIGNAANSPSLGTTTMRFFYDNNYMENLVIQNPQNGYTPNNVSDNFSSNLGGPFGFSANSAGVVAFDILDNAAVNPILLSTTPVTILDLCFEVTTTGDAVGVANNALCTAIAFSNNHTTGSGSGNDDGYGPSEGIASFYYLNGDTGLPNAGDDEVINYGWITDPAYDGVLNGASDTVGATDTANCTPYLCAVEYIQTISGPWDIASNWIDGVVPTVNDNAIIDDNVISYLRADQAVNNLTLDPGSTVSVPAGFTLNIKGNVTNNGDFTLYGVGAGLFGGDPVGTVGNPNVDGEVLLDGPANQDLIGTGDYYNLRVNNTNGVDVTESTVINGYLIVDQGNFTTNDATTFPCDFDSPTGPVPFTRHAVGQIGPVNGTITGNVTVEQCYPGRRAFRMVSASTTGSTIHNEWQENPSAYNVDPRPGYGTHITGLAVLLNQPNALGLLANDQDNGLDWQPSGTASMFSFNNGGQSWENVLNTNTTLTAGIPYLMTIRGSRAVDLNINASPTSNTKLESTGTASTGAVPVNTGISNGQFALVGNPYHAVVDLNQVVPGNGYTNFVTVYDPNIGGNANVNSSSTVLGGRGGYVTVDVSTGNANIATGITGVTATDATQFVQPYQSFFVQGATTGTPGALTFQEANKAVRATQTDVFDSSDQPRIFVNLFDKESLDNLSTPDDGLVIYFSDNSSNNVDDNDAPKFFNQDEVIARNENNSLISFENRAMPVENDVLELYTNQYRTTDYVLEIGVQFLPDHDVYLYDKYTNAEVLLSNNASNTYVFSVEQSTPASIATDRFGIVFETSTLGSNEFDLQGISVYPNPTTDILNISLGQNTGRFDSLELFDINGRLIAKQSLDNQLQNAQMDVNAFSSGVYILKVSSEREQFSTKVIVE